MKSKGNVLVIGREVRVKAVAKYLFFHSWQVYEASSAILGVRVVFEKPIGITILDSHTVKQSELNPIRIIKSVIQDMPILILGKRGSDLNIFGGLKNEKNYFIGYPWTGKDITSKLEEIEFREFKKSS